MVIYGDPTVKVDKLDEPAICIKLAEEIYVYLYSSLSLEKHLPKFMYQESGLIEDEATYLFGPFNELKSGKSSSIKIFWNANN